VAHSACPTAYSWISTVPPPKLPHDQYHIPWLRCQRPQEVVGVRKTTGIPPACHVQSWWTREDVLHLGNGVFRIAADRPGHDGLPHL
jgi:hypothetical protein